MRKVFLGAVALLLAASCQFSMSGLKDEHVGGWLVIGRPTLIVVDPAREGLRPAAREVRAYHGVVFVMSDLGAAAEGSLGGHRREGVEQHPFPDQLSRLKRAERELGTRYARFPRWGTLLSQEHLGRIGGIDAVVRAAQPAVIRDVSEGVYVQLTGAVATAMSGESLAKQARLTEALAPILPPVAPG